MTTLADQLAQLDSAKKLVEDDPQLYPQVALSVRDMTQRPVPELRRWSAQFLADALATPALLHSQRVDLAVRLVDTISSLLESGQDPDTLRFAIASAGSAYPLVFWHVCNDSADNAELWARATAMKRQVLSLWNEVSPQTSFSVLCACIKFGQQVVLTQTRAEHPLLDNTDTESVDVSLQMAPKGHPLIDASIEAEARGLLDRLMRVFDDATMDSRIATCTINVLHPLVRRRPQLAPRVLRSLIGYDSTAHVVNVDLGSRLGTTRAELECRSVDKAIKLMLQSLVKGGAIAKHAPAVYKYLEAMSQGRASDKLKRRLAQEKEYNDYQSQQRDYSAQQDHGSQGYQNQQLQSQQQPIPSESEAIQSLGPGPHSYAQLYQLVPKDDPLAAFDIRELPPQMTSNIALAGIAAVDPTRLQRAISAIGARILALKRIQDSLTPEARAALQAQQPLDNYNDDDDDLDVGFANKDAALNTVDNDDDDQNIGDLLPASAFSLPAPEPMTVDMKNRTFVDIVDRLMTASSKDGAEGPLIGDHVRSVVHGVAVSHWDANSWVIFASRLAARGLCNEQATAESVVSPSDVIRAKMYEYVLSDFRNRLDVFCSWMTEEWYVFDGSRDRSLEGEDYTNAFEDSTYFRWTSVLLDQIIPLLGMDDSKAFIRLLSDLPELNRSLVFKLRSLCVDPERAQVGLRALRFLLMLRPPAKPYCLELLREIHRTDESMQESVGAILKKFDN